MAELARHSGISYSTLTKLAQGHADNPTVNSLQAVIQALDAFDGGEPAVSAATGEEAAAQ